MSKDKQDKKDDSLKNTMLNQAVRLFNEVVQQSVNAELQYRTSTALNLAGKNSSTEQQAAHQQIVRQKELLEAQLRSIRQLMLDINEGNFTV